MDRGDGKKPDIYGPPDSRYHVNQGLKQQQQVINCIYEGKV